MYLITYKVLTAHDDIAGAKWETRVRMLATLKAAVKAAANVKAEGPSRKGVKIYFALPV